MDSRCRAWKLRNSSDIWRPNKHSLNAGNAFVDREKRSISDNYCKFSATKTDGEKVLQAKWKSSISFLQDAGSKSSSPILRYRTLSPDLCSAPSVDSMKISQNLYQAQDKNKITGIENNEVSKYVVCDSLGSKSSTHITNMIATKDNATSFEVSEKTVIGRSKSVSPHMRQEKNCMISNRTCKSIIARKRCQSSQEIVSKREDDTQNKFMNTQRYNVQKRTSSFSMEEMLFPSSQDLEYLQNKLILCLPQDLSNNQFGKKKTSYLNNQDDVTHTSSKSTNTSKSSEQCVTMRVNMAFEPIARTTSFTSCKSEHMKEKKTRACNSHLQEPLKKKVISENTLKEEKNKCEIRSTKKKCEKMTTCLDLEEYISPVYEMSEENCDVVEDILSSHGRRWPKLPYPTLDKSYLERLTSCLTTSNNDYRMKASVPKSEVKLLEETTSNSKIQLLKGNTPKLEIKQQKETMNIKSVGCQKDATKNIQNFHNEDGFLHLADQKKKKFKRKYSSSSDINLTNDVPCMSERFIENIVDRSSNKLSEEILPTFSSKIDCELKTKIFSSKSKQSLERATLAIIENERKDENSQWFPSCEKKSKETEIHNKVLTQVEVSCPQNLKDIELECNEDNEYNLETSLKMKKMVISGPADAFREIKINHIVRPIHFTSVESAPCVAPKSYTSDPCLEPTIFQSSIQQKDLTCDLKVLESPEQALSPFGLQDLAIINQSDEHSNENESIVLKIDEDEITSNSSLLKIYKNKQQHHPSKATVQEEKNVCFDNVSKTWSNPLHIENESSDRGSLSSEKVSSILSYLGHVEKSNLQENYIFLSKRDVQKETFFSLKGDQSPCTVLEHEDIVSLANSTLTTSFTNKSGTESKDEEKGMSSTISLFEGVRKKMQEFRSQIVAKESQNVKLLQDIETLKTHKAQAMSLERDRFDRELEARVRKYKVVIQHQLDLNEKMVKDKEVLSNKCCNLVGNLTTLEQKYEDKMKIVKEQFAQELKKQKEIWIAGEKPRREAWKEKKIKEIKELTIKGLEPHIDGLNEKHKQEIKRLEMRFADEMQKKLEVYSIQHREEICELRSRILKERDEIVEKERFATLKRLNDVAEKYEQQAMELRRKVSCDMAIELEKVEEARRKDKQIAHDMLSKAKKEWNEKEATLKDSLEESVQHAIVEKDAEIISLRSELEQFKTDWQKNFDEKLIKDLHVHEDEFKSRYIKERDEQIEMIIEKLEKEKDEAIAQQQQELLVKVESLMEEKLELMNKLKEVESKCAKLCKMSLEAKQKVEMEIATQDLQVESLQREVLSQTDLTKQLQHQIQQEKKNYQEQQQQYEFQLSKEHEIIQTKQLEIERWNEEKQQLRLRKVKELEEVEMHVKKAIENKDQIIAGLREQLMAAREQIRHTQLLLQQEHVAFLADPD